MWRCGPDGDWFRDPYIFGIGPITDTIDGTLYAAVNFWAEGLFEVSSGEITFEYDEESVMPTGTIEADIDGSWFSFQGHYGHFFAYFEFGNGWGGVAYVYGTFSASNISFEGCFEGTPPEGTWDVTDGGFILECNDFSGSFEFDNDEV